MELVVESVKVYVDIGELLDIVKSSESFPKTIKNIEDLMIEDILITSGGATVEFDLTNKVI